MPTTNPAPPLFGSLRDINGMARAGPGPSSLETQSACVLLAGGSGQGRYLFEPEYPPQQSESPDPTPMATEGPVRLCVNGPEPWDRAHGWLWPQILCLRHITSRERAARYPQPWAHFLEKVLSK